MQVITVNKDFLFSAACTLEMLTEIALHKDYVGVSQDYVNKLAKQELANGSSKRGAKSNASGDLPYAKLRTVLVQKLQDSPTVGTVFKEGNMQFEMQCLPDLDINAAGQNKARGKSGGKATVTDLKGQYVVVKNGLKCSEATDPGKWSIWQHIWASSSFEEFFSKAPKKAVTRTQRIITPSSEIRWAIKSGWIKPVGTAQQQEQAQEAAAQ